MLATRTSRQPEHLLVEDLNFHGWHLMLRRRWRQSSKLLCMGCLTATVLLPLQEALEFVSIAPCSFLLLRSCELGGDIRLLVTFCRHSQIILLLLPHLALKDAH